MTKTVNLRVPQSTLDEMNALLELEEVGDEDRHRVHFSITADFGDGYQADIEVCTGPNNAFVSPVLFLNGHEVDVPQDASDTLEGEYPFEHDGQDFIVNIEPEE